MTRILLVDANEEEGMDLDRSLRGRSGWDIVRVKTLLDAIRAAGESKFDAAVLDTDLPDGSGMDILDFLRIGSPNIRILLLSATPSEQIAFHALSHGAGDFVVKDKHLEQELPGRIDALLEHQEATGALVETLSAARSYEPIEFQPAVAQKTATNAIETALEGIVGGQVHAAGVWDLRGRPIAVKAPSDLDADGVGFALATLHGQVGALWTYGNIKPTGYRLVIDVEGGVLAVTAIPGTYVVALLFDAGFAARRAIERVDQAGIRILAALQGGSSGDDIPPST